MWVFTALVTECWRYPVCVRIVLNLLDVSTLIQRQAGYESALCRTLSITKLVEITKLIEIEMELQEANREETGFCTYTSFIFTNFLICNFDGKN